MIQIINFIVTNNYMSNECTIIIILDEYKSIMGGMDTDQLYSVRWNEFHTSIITSFRHLLDQEDFIDVTIACDGHSFTAHKVVLSACSPYFRSLLKVNIISILNWCNLKILYLFKIYVIYPFLLF